LSLEPVLVPATVHGRYYLRKAGGKPSSALLVAFHGYGQHAKRMLAELERIEGMESWNVLSIQALHPFYDPDSRRVGASWMTRQDREVAIADNLAYVRDVVGKVKSQIGEGGPLVYLGFSQGAAMAHRSAVLAGIPCQGVIAVVGDVPPELGEHDLSQVPPVLIACGSRDAWYDEFKLRADVKLLRDKGVEVDPFRFDGSHEWTEALRRRCAEFLHRLGGEG